MVRRAERSGKAALHQRERPPAASPGWHCFDVKFDKHAYVERMRFDENQQSSRLELPHGRSAMTLTRTVTPADVRRGGVASGRRRPPYAGASLEHLRRPVRRAASFVKCENFQRMGAFKFRGAYNFLSTLSPEQRARGVVAYSSGNHAQGVALAARLFGIPATIVMPERCTGGEARGDARVRGRGRAVRSSAARTAKRSREGIASERGATLVPPFDDARIVAGAGTAALELLDEVGALDAIVVPVGGGGLICRDRNRRARPRPRDRDIRSRAGRRRRFCAIVARAGERVTIPVPQTIADGLHDHFAQRPDLCASRASTSAPLSPSATKRCAPRCALPSSA